MRFILCMFLFCAVAGNLQARNLTLNEAVAYGVAGSPLASKIKAQTAQSFADGLDDAVLQNPELEFTYRADSSSEIALAQPLRLSDVLLERYSYRRSLKRLQSMEEKLDLLRISQNISMEYYALYAAQQELGFLQGQLSLAQKMQKRIESTIYNGLSAAEMAVFGAENKSLGAEVARLKKTVAVAELNFARELKTDSSSLVLAAPPAFKTPASTRDLQARLAEFPNQQKVLKLRYEQAKKNLDMLKKDRWLPAVSPKVGYGLSSYERSDDWNVGVGLAIPLWNQNKGRLAAAKAEALSSQAELNALEQVSFEEAIQKQFEVLKANQTQLLVYQNQILPEFRKASQKMEQNFMSGAVQALDLLQVRDKEWTAKRQYLQLLQQTLQAQNELELMIGSRLEDL